MGASLRRQFVSGREEETHRLAVALVHVAIRSKEAVHHMYDLRNGCAATRPLRLHLAPVEL
jgi:hypothetical protein